MRFLVLSFILLTLSGVMVTGSRACADSTENTLQTGWQKQDNFLSHRALGPSCNSIRNLRIDPPCNPAFLGQDREEPKEETEGLLAAQLFVGDTYQYFYKNRDLFASPDKRQLIADLLAQKQAVGFEGGFQMWWKQKPFVFGIEPLRLHSYSEVINSAYPDILLEGVYQQGFYFRRRSGIFTENTRWFRTAFFGPAGTLRKILSL